MITLTKAHPLFLQEEDMPILELQKEDYELRMERLVARIRQEGLSHVIIYGDREHFSNVEYFTRYDCRFEETLMIVSAEGERSIILGNEGMGYSQIIPIPINRYLYQHFSLQGQPRHKLVSLPELLAKTGITPDSQVGIIGIKYFEPGMIDSDPAQTYDLPEYMMTAIRKACPNIRNTTAMLTGVPDGIRTRLYTAREIAWAESVGNRVATVVQRLIKNLRPGVLACELPREVGVGFDPINTHPLVNFGEWNVAVGMPSPVATPLVPGKPGGVDYSLRGNLTSRTSMLADSLENWDDAWKPYYESFYKVYYQAIATWYETARVGVTGGELHKVVMDLLGGEEFGVALNVSHYTATEEWINAITYQSSTIPVLSGSFIQVDIIASGTDPVRTAICEDAVVIAGAELRQQLEAEYPETYARIQKRRQVMAEVLGIHLHEDVLPMSNLNGVYFPFLLDPTQVFRKEN